MDVFLCMCWSVCHRYTVAVKMTLYASDGFKPWWLWVNVWRVHAENGFCLEGEKKQKKKKQPFSPYQGAGRTGPITSHCWAINVELIASQGEKKSKGWGWLGFACLLSFSFSINLSYSTVWCVCVWIVYAGLQSFILVINYKLKGQEQADQTEWYKLHYRDRDRGKDR